MKFGRTYQLSVEGSSGTVHEIVFPLTVRFRICNTSLFGGSSCFIQIYNLTQDVRNDLFKDWSEIFTYRAFRFAAGYTSETNEIPEIFRGNVIQASSFRQGADWITEIQALDGMFAKENGSVNLSKPAPYSFEDMLAEAVKAMPRVSLGIIGAFDVSVGKPSRGLTFAGNPWDLIAAQVQPLQGAAVIRKETVHIVQQWEYLADQGQLDLISDQTGLLGTPRLLDFQVKARMIFEPRLEIMQKVTLQTLEVRMNGDYRVSQVDHQGTISGAVCEDMITDVTLFRPPVELVAA